MRSNKSVKNVDAKEHKSILQLVVELLIIAWLLIAGVQYVAKYYIIIPEIDYHMAYIIMLCIYIAAGIVKLVQYLLSKSNRNGETIRRHTP